MILHCKRKICIREMCPAKKCEPTECYKAFDKFYLKSKNHLEGPANWFSFCDSEVEVNDGTKIGDCYICQECGGENYVSASDLTPQESGDALLAENEPGGLF